MGAPPRAPLPDGTGVSAEAGPRSPPRALPGSAGLGEPRSRRREGPAGTCSAEDADWTSGAPGEGSGGWGPRSATGALPYGGHPQQDLATPACLLQAPSDGTPALTTAKSEPAGLCALPRGTWPWPPALHPAPPPPPPPRFRPKRAGRSRPPDSSGRCCPTRRPNRGRQSWLQGEGWRKGQPPAHPGGGGEGPGTAGRAPGLFPLSPQPGSPTLPHTHTHTSLTHLTLQPTQGTRSATSSQGRCPHPHLEGSARLPEEAIIERSVTSTDQASGQLWCRLWLDTVCGAHAPCTEVRRARRLR